MSTFARDKQYIKFSSYGFLKNLRFFDAYILLFFREMGISYTLSGSCSPFGRSSPISWRYPPVS